MPGPTPGVHLPPEVQPARVLVWVLHLALPVAALWLLLARPQIDAVWQHQPSHFWLVLAVAAVNVALGARMSVTARRHTDARLFLVSLAFLSSAGFLALHALATPGVLISHANTGFDLAQPVGLALASVFAVASCLPFSAHRAHRTFGALVVLRAVVAGLLVAWAVVSLADLPPLNQPPPTRDVEGPVAIVAAVSVGLYVIAAVRFYLLHRRSPAAVLLSLVTAFVLLAESMVAVILAPKWHLSWWEWHVLLTFAFGFVAYSAYIQYRREGTSAGLFDAIGLRATNERIRAEYGAALEDLVTALQERERSGAEVPPDSRLAARLADRFGLTEGQTAVLDRAGGTEVVLAVRGPGALLGELSALDREPRSATVTALEPVSALLVPVADFEAFLQAHGRVAYLLMRTVIGRLRDADRKRIEFGAHDTIGRVAARLVEMAERFGQPTTDGLKIALPFSQDELAGWIGASREAVSKALGVLRAAGTIRTSRMSVIVRDLPDLRRRAQ